AGTLLKKNSLGHAEISYISESTDNGNRRQAADRIYIFQQHASYFIRSIAKSATETIPLPM
ncbi:hypothetical protein ACE8C3_22475, partial [Xanthomonas euvesicatoria pv. euvesicatoria]